MVIFILRLYGNRAGPPRRDPASTDHDPRSRLEGLEIAHINALPVLARLSGLSVIAYSREYIVGKRFFR